MEVLDQIQSGHQPDATDASTEYTLHPSIHLSRRRNLLASPLLRLPTELILKIFVHAVELDGDDDDSDDNGGDGHGNHGQLLLIITVICHQLRETGIASPQLIAMEHHRSHHSSRCRIIPRTMQVRPTYPHKVPACLREYTGVCG